MDGGAGDELPGLNEQGFDVLGDGDAQTRWLVEQLAIMDGANTPGVPANLHKCPGVAQAAATSLERAKSPIPANHASADNFYIDIFGSHADQGTFGKPHTLSFAAGPLKHCHPQVKPAIRRP